MGPQNGAQIAGFLKKDKLWGVPKGLQEGGRKNTDFGSPSKAENEAGA